MPIHESGTMIAGRYEVVQGPCEKPSLAGGMGLVYLCVDHAENGRPVALKTFRPELLPDRAARDRFLREGTTWVQLGQHPHIVRCHEVFKADIGPEVFFVLELVGAAEGKRDASLRSWLIPGKPLSVEQALLFALHIARGMKQATTKIPGLVHRDLKPENVLVGRDGMARIADFGLVQALPGIEDTFGKVAGGKSGIPLVQHMQISHGMVGTPLYMSPEQWRGEVVDQRSDIYALGCMVYEMVTGQFAVKGKSIAELEAAHLAGWTGTLSHDISKRVADLMRQCSAAAPEKRMASWAEVESALVAVSEAGFVMWTQVANDEAKDDRTDRLAAGWSYNAMGLSFQDIGKYIVAKEYFGKALEIAQARQDRALEGSALGNLGSAHRLLGDARQAIRYFEQDLAIARELDDRYGEAQTLGNLGNAHIQLGQVRCAIEYYEKDLAIVREIGNRNGEGNVLGNLGNAYLQLGDPRRAIEYHEKHLAIAREIGSRHGEGQALGNLGNAYGQLRDAQHAIKYYEQSLMIKREIGDRHGEGNTLGNLGEAYRLLGNPQRAVEFQEQRLAITREVGDRHGEAAALGNLGNAYRQLGDTLHATECYEQSLRIKREIGDVTGTALTNFNLALLCVQQGDIYTAKKHAQAAMETFTQIGHPQYIQRAKALLAEIQAQRS